MGTLWLRIPLLERIQREANRKPPILRDPYLETNPYKETATIIGERET